jgi:maltokinase
MPATGDAGPHGPAARQVTALPAPLDALPLPGGATLFLEDDDGTIVVRPVGALAGGGGAEVGEGAFEGLLALLRAGEPSGRFTFLRLGDVPDATGERAITVDQSNRSVVVGERVVVKVFPRTTAGPQPAFDLPAHLAAVGFVGMPRPFGAVTWTDDLDRSVLVATAAAFLPGARDGWAWYLDLLLSWLAGDVDEFEAFGPADRVGELAGGLHVALASASSVLASPVTYVDADDVRAWKTRAEVALDEALALTTGEEGARLRGREGRIRAAFDVIDQVRTAPAMRIHGDLHVGQILRWDGGDAITDFDGNPLAPRELRMARDTPVRDVASLVRSVDHLGRIAQRRDAGPVDEIERWIARSRESVVEAYLRTLDRSGHSSLYDPTLLFPLEVAQVCHEYAYAARYLPSWLRIPDLAIQAIFP